MRFFAPRSSALKDDATQASPQAPVTLKTKKRPREIVAEQPQPARGPQTVAQLEQAAKRSKLELSQSFPWLQQEEEDDDAEIARLEKLLGGKKSKALSRAGPLMRIHADRRVRTPSVTSLCVQPNGMGLGACSTFRSGLARTA